MQHFNLKKELFYLTSNKIEHFKYISPIKILLRLLHRLLICSFWYAFLYFCYLYRYLHILISWSWDQRCKSHMSRSYIQCLLWIRWCILQKETFLNNLSRLTTFYYYNIAIKIYYVFNYNFKYLRVNIIAPLLYVSNA